MYWNSLYDNIDIKYYCKDRLPMRDFTQGDFSQAHKIIDVYRDYIKKCITELTHKHAGGNGNISDYLTTQLSNLKEEHVVRTAKKKKAMQDMKDIKKQIDEEIAPLKNGGNGDKVWDSFFNFRKKHNYETELLERAFADAKHTEPEKYNKYKGLFEKFVSLANRIDNEKIETLWKKYHEAKTIKSDATHTLSHKSNRLNLEKQISDIETGKKYRHIQSDIQKDLLRLFNNAYHMDWTLDERDLQEIFISIFATNLITDIKTEKNLKKSLVKNHTDKVGLFSYVWKVYDDISSMFVGIDFLKREDTFEHKDTLMEKKIEEIVAKSRDILQKIPHSGSYFWPNSDSPDEMKCYFSMSSEEWKEKTIQELLVHLEKTLKIPKKETPRRGLPDLKLQKIFEGIYAVTETSTFEEYCELLWNIDWSDYYSLLGTEGKILLKDIYIYMNQEERSITESGYGSWGLFEQIEKDVLDQEESETAKQLSLYTFDPIYSIEGYLEKVATHIESIIGSLSFRQKRVIMGIVCNMLSSHGVDEYIDSGKVYTRLIDDDFLETLKNTKGYKGLSSKLKKIDNTLLPDINQRIYKLKKTVKHDIL